MDSSDAHRAFRPAIYERWLPSGMEVPVKDPSAVLVAVRPPHLASGATVLDLAEGPRIITMGSGLADRAGVREGTILAANELDDLLVSAGLIEHEAGFLFYLPNAYVCVARQAETSKVRRLDRSDHVKFDALMQVLDAEDREEAAVGLDDWVAYGAFRDGELVAAASAYLEHDNRFADIGVVTARAHRGVGHARALVTAITEHIVRAGLEPQYRSDASNYSSHRLAVAAGFKRFCAWRTFD